MDRRSIRVGCGATSGELYHGYESRATERAINGKLESQYAGDSKRAFQVEAAVGEEIAERVCDETAAVELHPPKDVGTVADDRISAGVDHRARPPTQVPARLLSQRLGDLAGMLRVYSLGAAVKGHDE